MANKKFVVTHPKLYMKDAKTGKMAHIEKGTEISIDAGHAKSLEKQGKILVVGAGKKVNVGSKAEKTEKTEE